MNHLGHMQAALSYQGESRIRKAWLMGRASYAYTASFIGTTDPSKGEPVFTRWYAFKSAVECGWDYLFKRSHIKHD